MALNDVTISFDLNQLLGADFDANGVKAYVKTNVANQTLIDTSTGEIRLGEQRVTIQADGTGSFTTWGVGADGNPTSWQTSLVVDYRRAGSRDRPTRTFGPYTITDADNGKNLAELEDQQAIPPNYQTAFTADMETIRDEAEAARDAAVDISNIDTSDGVVSALVEGTGGAGPLTRSALSASYVRAKAPEGYGAAVDGVTNDYTAITDALAAAETAGVAVVLAAGDYYVGTSSSVTIPDRVRLVGVPGSRIVGARAGSHIVNLGSRSQLAGVEVDNTDSTGVCVVLRANSAGARIADCTFSSVAAQGVSLSSSGISDVSITGCTFDGLGYGVLANSGTGTGAHDLRGVTISDCTFTDIVGDAIEFNHPTTASTAAGGYVITGNRINVPDRADAGLESSGFGVGMANCRDFVISDNVFDGIRQQAIHIEDDCSHFVVSGNTIKNVNGTLMGVSASLNNGITIAKSQHGEITNNVITDCRGIGIQLVFDGTTVNSDLAIRGNRADNCDKGFSAYAIAGAKRIVVENNSAVSNTSHGFEVGGAMDSIIVRDNFAQSNGGYGIACGSDIGYLRVFERNVLLDNTSGDVQGFAVTAGAPAIIHDRHAVATGTTSGNVAYPTAFRLGAWAQGRLILEAGSGSTRIERVYWLFWNGTTLYLRTLQADSSGVVDVKVHQLNAGSVVLEVYTGAASASYRASARFLGTIVETGATYVGTVTPTLATALGAAATDAATTQTLANNIRTALIALGLASA